MSDANAVVEGPALEVRAVSKTYGDAGARVAVLHDIDFRLEPGESLAITGRSGSGKSTLLACIAGLEGCETDGIRIGGERIDGLDGNAAAELRGRSMGFIFQSFRLLPHLTALENVAVPLELLGRRAVTTTAQDWLERVGLGERADHRPSQLSGGEQQRVALARALAPEPAVLLADEPTGNLDEATGSAMAALLFEAVRAHGLGLLLVTHDRALAARADRQLVLVDGRMADA